MVPILASSDKRFQNGQQIFKEIDIDEMCKTRYAIQCPREHAGGLFTLQYAEVKDEEQLEGFSVLSDIDQPRIPNDD